MQVAIAYMGDTDLQDAVTVSAPARLTKTSATASPTRADRRPRRVPARVPAHVTWMQRVWFEECVGGTSRRQLGLVQSPDESFRLADDDTIASVTAAYRQACASPGKRSPTCRWTPS